MPLVRTGNADDRRAAKQKTQPRDGAKVAVAVPVVVKPSKKIASMWSSLLFPTNALNMESQENCQLKPRSVLSTEGCLQPGVRWCHQRQEEKKTIIVLV